MKVTLFALLAVVMLPTSSFASKALDPWQDVSLDKSPQWNYAHHGTLAALLTATYHGNVSGISFALKHHAPLNGSFPPGGLTALELASLDNNLTLVKYLLNRGAKINQVAGTTTALDCALSNPTVYKYLQSRGAASYTDIATNYAPERAAQEISQLEHPSHPSPPPLQLTGSSMSTVYGDDGSVTSRTVTGTVVNNSKKDYDYVEVDVNFYNDSDQQVGSEIDNTQDLEAGSTWAFKVTYIGGDALAYKIKKVFGR